MTTMVNRDVIVMDDGQEIRARCIDQSLNGDWIKVLLADGCEQMVHVSDFIGMADEAVPTARTD